MRFGRKILAVVMAAMLLMGMMPTSMAMNFWCPDEGLEHSWGPVEWYNGSSCNGGMHYCTRCGAGEEVPPQHQEHWEYEQNAMPTCTEGGIMNKVCSVCGEYTSEMEVGPLGHDWRWSESTSGNCQTPAMEYATCARCGATSSRQGAYGDHVWGAWNVVSQGNCTTPRTEERRCTVCGKEEQRAGDKGEHAWGQWQTKMEATCTKDGVNKRECSRCGIEESTYIGKLGHKFGEWVVIQEPDQRTGEPGIKERKCVRCGLTEQQKFYPDGANIRGDSGDSIRDVQEELNNKGYDCGEPDGKFGPKTEEEWKNWQEDNGYKPDGIMWPNQVEDLLDGDDGHNDGGNNGEDDATGENDSAYVAAIDLELLGGTEARNAAEGDVVTVQLKLTNTGDITLTAISYGVYFPEGGWDETNFLEDWFESNDPNWGFFRSGQYDEFSCSFTVRAEDVAAGEIRRTFKHNAQPWYYQVNGVLTDIPVVEGVEAPEGGDPMVARADKEISDSVEIVIPLNGGSETDGIVLTKSVVSTAEYYYGNDTVTYAISIENTSDETYYDVIVYDPILEFAELKAYDVMEPGFKDTIEFNYNVTNQDVINGSIENTAFVVRPGGADAQDRIYSNTVTVKTAAWSYTFGDTTYQLGGMEVVKTVVSSPANGEYYVPGETISYRIDATNISTIDLYSMTITDALAGGMKWSEPAAIEPGTAGSAVFDYVVTPMDAVAGSITNIATAWAYEGENHAGTKFVATSNPVTVKTGFEGDFPFGVITDLEIIKEETSTPANGTYYTEGETISYKITYKNIGETMLNEVIIYDSLATADIAYAEMLDAGESRYCTFSYVVTAEDVAKGYVVNTAIAKFDYNGYIATVTSEPVVSDTDGDANTTFVPGPGKIDWESLRGTGTDENGNALPEEDTCYIEPVVREGMVVEYKAHFCSKHAATHKAILTMAQSADDDNMQMVWEYACGLWQKDVDAMYEEILAVCDDSAKITVMNERVTHLAMIANAQFALRIAQPDQMAETIGMIAKMWQDKCMELCYLMNTAPSARVDSVFSVERSAGEAEVEEKCSCVVSEETEEQILFADHYCAVHGFTYEMTEILLMADTSEETWATVRSLWEMELNNAYNALYKEASEEGGKAYLAEYSAYLQWLSSQEIFLNAAYQQNAQIVAEVMVNSIMDRTQDGCER